MILAAAHFLYQARMRVVPNPRAVIAPRQRDSFLAPEAAAGDQERVLRDMAPQNFPVNLGILRDLVNELYVKTTALDRIAHEKKTPVYERIPELKELGRYLVVQLTRSRSRLGATASPPPRRSMSNSVGEAFPRRRSRRPRAGSARRWRSCPPVLLQQRLAQVLGLPLATGGSS